MWVPIFVGLMSGIFAIYLLLKGLKRLYEVDTQIAIIAGTIFGVCIYAFVTWRYRMRRTLFEDSKKFVNTLFNIPLIFAV